MTSPVEGEGLAICSRLEADGCRVIGVDLPGHGAEAGADLSGPEGRTAAVKAVLEASSGILDGLVCNAGVDVSNAQLVFAVNYFGTVEVMQGLQPALAAAPYAAVVLNISNSIHITPNVPVASVEALIAGDTSGAEAMLGDREHVAYQVSKMAVARWMRRSAHRPEWAGAGIRCNGIGPGPVLTDLLKKDLADPKKAKDILALPRPLGDFATPEGVADVVAFLLSPQARYLVGQILYIDGGQEPMIRGNDVPLPWQPGDA